MKKLTITLYFGLGAFILSSITACTYPIKKLEAAATPVKYLRLDMTVVLNNMTITFSDYRTCEKRATYDSARGSHTYWVKSKFYTAKVLSNGSAIVSYFPDCDEKLPHKYNPWLVFVKSTKNFNCFDYHHPEKDNTRNRSLYVLSATVHETTKQEYTQNNIGNIKSKLNKLYKVIFGHTEYQKYSFQTVVAIVKPVDAFNLSENFLRKLNSLKKPTFVAYPKRKYFIRRQKHQVFGMYPKNGAWNIAWNKRKFERWCSLEKYPYLIRTNSVRYKKQSLPVRVNGVIFNAQKKGWIYLPSSKKLLFFRIGRSHRRVNIRSGDKTDTIEYGDSSNK